MNQNISLKNFKKYLQDNDFSDLTVRGYLSDLNLFSQWFEQTNGENMKLEQITPTDVKEYRQRLLTVENHAANTVNRKLASLSALMQWALNSGKISSDPTQKIKLVRKVESAPKWLDKHEQFALSRAIERDLQLAKLRYPKRWVTRRRDASLVLFMLNTGLRLGEAVSLQVEDVQLSDRRGNVMVRNGKGNKQRSIPLNNEARQALKDWYEVRPESKFVWTVVEGDTGSSLSGRTVQRLIFRYAQEASLDDLTPHVLRHSFAKNLVNAGVGLEKVAALLGHGNLNTTRIYVTPSEKDLELAVETLT
jgi:site-specific recombinase XerD